MFYTTSSYKRYKRSLRKCNLNSIRCIGPTDILRDRVWRQNKHSTCGNTTSSGIQSSNQNLYWLLTPVTKCGPNTMWFCTARSMNWWIQTQPDALKRVSTQNECVGTWRRHQLITYIDTQRPWPRTGERATGVAGGPLIPPLRLYSSDHITY